MSPEEKEDFERQKKAAKAAKSLTKSPNWKVLEDWLKELFDIEGPSISHQGLMANRDGITKALISQRNDGHKDIFAEIERLKQFNPEEIIYNQEDVEHE